MGAPPSSSRATGRACCWVLLVVATLACAAKPDDGGEEAVGGSDDDPHACTPGRFGCTCMPSMACAAGLECVDELCELIDETGGDPAPPSACGWNLATQWYDCGFRGSDPNGEFPLACPDGLVADAPCPASLPFEGCCDAEGDVWYCDEGQIVHTAC